MLNLDLEDASPEVSDLCIRLVGNELSYFDPFVS